MTDSEELRAIAYKLWWYPDVSKRLVILAERAQRRDECLDAIVQESLDTSRSRHEAIREE